MTHMNHETNITKRTKIKVYIGFIKVSKLCDNNIRIVKFSTNL